MIVDNLRNYSLYLEVNKGFQGAFKFIEEFNKSELPVGRYEIDGNNVYALVQSYETKPVTEKKWETHKEYIDLQYVVRGKENIGWINKNGLTPCTSYSVEKDCTLYEELEGTSVKLGNSDFMILFPEDAHKPGCIWEEKQIITKIVIKIKA